MTKITAVITSQGITKLQAYGDDFKERTESLLLIQKLLPAFEKMDAILKHYLREEDYETSDRIGH